MNALYIDFIGYTAIIVNLYSMSSKGEYRLRIISLIANFIFLLYGSLIGAIPLIVGSIIAICLHSYRLTKIRKSTEQ